MTDEGYSPQRILPMIWSYIEELHLDKEYAAENMLRVHYHGIFGEIKVMIHAHNAGVLISVNPAVQRPTDGWGQSVQKLIEKINKQAQLVQVGVDKDGDVFVKVELPPQEISFGDFLSVFLSICRITEDLLVPVWQAHVYDTFSTS